MILNKKLLEAALVAYLQEDRARPGVGAAITHYLTHRTLQDRAREAADTLVAMTNRYHNEATQPADEIDWRPVNLRYVADLFDSEDAAQAEQDGLALEVAHELIASYRKSSDVADHAARLLARFDVKRREVS